MFLKAAVLEGHGRRTPLLPSKELLRRLGAVMELLWICVWMRFVLGLKGQGSRWLRGIRAFSCLMVFGSVLTSKVGNRVRFHKIVF